MDSHGNQNKDDYIRDRLRYVRRDVKYARRQTPMPARHISDIYDLSNLFGAVKEEAVVESPTKVEPAKAKTLPASVVQHRSPAYVAKPTKKVVRLAKSIRSVPVGKYIPKTQPMLYAAAGLLFALGVTASFMGFQSNNQVSQQLRETVEASDGSAADNTPPSTDKPTDEAIANYKVSADMPKYINIPKLSVQARIISMSVKASGELKAPGNVYDGGWYSSSSKPGENGAMLIDGHISSWTTKGVFYGINTLKAGDEIKITRGDDKVFTYKVVSVSVSPVDQLNMADVLVSADTARPGLNLISCMGDVIPGTNEFDKRVVVNAVMVD